MAPNWHWSDPRTHLTYSDTQLPANAAWTLLFLTQATVLEVDIRNLLNLTRCPLLTISCRASTNLSVRPIPMTHIQDGSSNNK